MPLASNFPSNNGISSLSDHMGNSLMSSSTATSPMYGQFNQPMSSYGTGHHKYGSSDSYGMTSAINVDNLQSNVMNALHRNDINAVQSIVLLTIQANIDSIQYENESKVNTSLSVNSDMINQSGLDHSIKSVVLVELSRIQKDNTANIQFYVNEAKRSSEMYRTLAQSWVSLTTDVAVNQIVSQIPKIQRAIDHIMNILEVRITPIADHAAGYIDRVTRDTLIKSNVSTQRNSNYGSSTMNSGVPSYGLTTFGSTTNSGSTPTTSHPYGTISGTTSAYSTPTTTSTYGATTAYPNTNYAFSYGTGQNSYCTNPQQYTTGTTATGSTMGSPSSTYSGTV